MVDFGKWRQGEEHELRFGDAPSEWGSGVVACRAGCKYRVRLVSVRPNKIIEFWDDNERRWTSLVAPYSSSCWSWSPSFSERLAEFNREAAGGPRS